MDKPRILYIEDNEQNLYLVSYLLANNNCEVLQAREGGEGIRLAEQESPDLILLDIQLPGMNGYEVARALRNIEGLKDTPIVAVTSYAMPGDMEKTIEAGCTGYIEKPIVPETFYDQIKPYLNK